MLERLRAVAFDRGVKGESGALLALWILMAGSGSCASAPDAPTSWSTGASSSRASS